MAETDAEKLFLQASMLYDAKQYQRAEKAVRDYLALDHLGDTKAWILLAEILKCLDNEAGAYEAIDYALHLESNNPIAHNIKGNVAIHFGHTDVAISHYEQSVKICPNGNLAFGGLAILFVNKRRYDEALNHARIGLQYDPNDSNCLNALTHISARKGQVLKAIKFSGLSLNSNPLSTQNLANTAISYFRFFRFYKAFKMSESALKINPEDDRLLQLTRLTLLAMFIPYGIAKALLALLSNYRILIRIILLATILVAYYFLFIRSIWTEELMIPLLIVSGGILYLPITRSMAIVCFTFSKYAYLIDKKDKIVGGSIVISCLSALIFILFIQSSQSEFLGAILTHVVAIVFQLWMPKVLGADKSPIIWTMLFNAIALAGCYLVLFFSGFWFVVYFVCLSILMTAIGYYYKTLEND